MLHSIIYINNNEVLVMTSIAAESWLDTRSSDDSLRRNSVVWERLYDREKYIYRSMSAVAWERRTAGAV